MTSESKDTLDFASKLKGIFLLQLFFIKRRTSSKGWLKNKAHIAVFKNNSARPTKQGDLHSFFCADSENQVFDTRFSVRKIFFWPCGAIFWQNFYFD